MSKSSSSLAKSQKLLPGLQCAACGKEQDVSQYYQSFNPIHKTGRIPYCKKCLKEMIVDVSGHINMVNLKRTLQLIDRPFLYDLWVTSESKNKDTFGIYMKNIAMRHHKNLQWADSEFESRTPDRENDEEEDDDVQYSPRRKQTLETFEITDRIAEKWGAGYTKEEYFYFEAKWNKLITNYGEKTSFHIESLITYIRFRVKEEMATAAGDLKSAKDWATMAKDAASAAKINVSQLSKSDISGGIDLLPQLFEAVESNVGIIPILPKLKEQPYDDADLIIWCNINYTRRLEDKPRIAYRDIWNFYDEMLQEYFTQQGYKPEQVEIEKKKRNNVFRDLGEIYIEPVYEEENDDGGS